MMLFLYIRFMRLIIILILINSTSSINYIPNCLNCSNNNDFSVLVLTETADYVHESIETGIELIKYIGDRNKFNVYHSDDSRVIKYNNLENIKTLIFLNTTADILSDEEQLVMEKFIQSGKGYVGIHSASDTEYEWKWYGELVGGYYKSHPDGTTTAKVLKIENGRFSKHLEPVWEIEDEWYNFNYTNDGINVILELDEESYYGGENGDYHPITWYHNYDGGRSFYTGLGHLKEVYSNKMFIKLLEQGILYASFVD